ncbi:hypothetical protein [Nonomuraea jiangxiensis]|uniref:GyrI-like small molecule binding domain-containing protein n=1 Tax=Nonomuraea jiangxiensis TaxID=633440 RepID=A0A1G8JIB3_9ACTN|nr:hypothetical protein [Nonomuraea jiangxiensis]SDI30896.1 hypothetical protein SAMN05421869_10594 [Nonomuraea jiangxiensis]
MEVLREGPFSEAYRSLAFMAERGLVAAGPRHEVYLTRLDDPAPRTVLRQPVSAV